MDELMNDVQAQGISQTVLDNPKTHASYMVSVQHTIYILGGIAGACVLGVMLLAGLGRAVPEAVTVIAATCVGGLVGFIAGQAVQP